MILLAIPAKQGSLYGKETGALVDRGGGQRRPIDDAAEKTAFPRRRMRVAAGLLVATAIAATCVCPATGSVSAGGRAWELVTPPDPVSATVASLTAIGAQGDRFAYRSRSSMPGAQAGDMVAHNLAVRDASGWHTEPIGAAFTVPRFSFFNLFGMIRLPALNGDLTSFVFTSMTPLLPVGPPEPRIGVYRAEVGGELTLIADLGTEGAFAGASADVNHVFLGTVEHLLPGDAGRAQGESIYESVGSVFRQVDVATDGSLLSECGSQVPKGGVSASGDRVFFTNPAPAGAGPCGEAPARVYLRESASKTVEVSTSHCSRPDCNNPQSASFAGATPSGSVAFITTEQQLTNDDVNPKRDLYRFEAEGGGISLVSPGSIEMEGAVGASEVLTSADGTSTYFRAEGRLLPGQGSEGGTNLYLADDTGLRLIGPIEPDNPFEISADGRTAVFTSEAKLEGGDTDEEADAYLYDADTGNSTRLSAGPAGGNGPFSATLSSGPEIILAPQSFHRVMTEDGRTVFFSTAEPLVAEDHNSATDIYEWSGGALGLISSGSGDDPAHFAATTPDGGTVLFRTSASLLPSDRDGGDMDFYAARVGGGFEEGRQLAGTCPRCTAAQTPLVRPEPASTIRRSAGKKGRIRLRRLGQGAGRSIAATGRAILEISVPAPGRVSAKARGKVGGRLRTVASGVGGAVRPGELRLQLVARPAARRQLIREGVLRFHLTLRQAPLQMSRTVSVRLDESK